MSTAKAVVIGAAIIAVSLIGSAVIDSYYSPYQICKRELRAGEYEFDALRANAVCVGARK
jgi:hypothetical protein